MICNDINCALQKYFCYTQKIVPYYGTIYDNYTRAYYIKFFDKFGVLIFEAYMYSPTDSHYHYIDYLGLPHNKNNTYGSLNSVIKNNIKNQEIINGFTLCKYRNGLNDFDFNCSAFNLGSLISSNNYGGSLISITIKGTKKVYQNGIVIEAVITEYHGLSLGENSSYSSSSNRSIYKLYKKNKIPTSCCLLVCCEPNKYELI